MTRLLASIVLLPVAILWGGNDSSAQFLSETGTSGSLSTNATHEAASSECTMVPYGEGRVPGDLSRYPNEEELIRAAFQQAFDVTVPEPAFAPSLYQDWSVTRWTSTVYLDSTLRRLNVFADGRYYAATRRVLRPEGAIRTIGIAIDHGNTNIAQIHETLWVEAQTQVNDAYRAMAEQTGLPSPVVSFQFTNILVDADEIADPDNFAAVSAFLESRGFSGDDYDVAIVFDLDAQNPGEDPADSECRFVYASWILEGEDSAVIDQEKALALINTAYGQGVAQLWGWEPEWSPHNYSFPRVPWSQDWIDPALLGWEDTDGDGVLEILDATPYGLTLPPAPLPVGPEDGAQEIPIEAALSWEPVQGADRYHVQVARNDFSTSQYENPSVRGTRIEAELLSWQTRYSWRVRAEVNDEYGFWSEVRTFTTVARGNSAPYVYAPVEDFTLPVGSSDERYLMFADDDWDLLTYTVGSSNEEVVTAEIRTYSQTFEKKLMTTAISEGSVTVRVTATDPFGASATHSFGVYAVASVAAERAGTDLPTAFALNQNYPNPFNPTTTITFDLPHQSTITLTVFDVLGKEAAVLASGDYPAGQFQTVWDAKDFPSGIYLYRLDAGAYQETRKLVLQR